MKSGTCVIVGAGCGLGQGIARAFGGAGYTIALVARKRGHLDRMVSALAAEGIAAHGFEGDVTRPDTLAAAFAAIRQTCPPIEVLEYSPTPAIPPDMRDWIALGATPAIVDGLMKLLVYGLMHSVQQVLPQMLARGKGSILVTTSGSGRYPVQALAPIGMAMGAARNYAHCLHQALQPKGLFVGSIVVNALIEKGHAITDPDTMARRYLELHTLQDRIEFEVATDEAPHAAHERDMRQRGHVIPTE